jgi:hypothetical protein
MPSYSRATALFVPLAGRPMLTGTPSWPRSPDRRALSQAALQQALVDVLGYAHTQAPERTSAEAVATAILGAFGNGRWTLRSAPGAAEILGTF